MKKLAIYFSDPEPMGYPFNVSTYPYWNIYREIIHNIELCGVEVYIVRGLKSYLGQGTFTHGWRIANGELELVHEKIVADLVFHRGSQETIPEHDDLFVNSPEFERFCGDKVRVAEMFEDLSPKTKPINSFQEYQNVITNWGLKPEDRVVLKKNFLYGGHGVNILLVKDIQESLYENWSNILIQEFIDSSVGIPGIVYGLHDIRVTTINGEPVYTFVRTPASGSFLANIAQGGNEIPLDISRVPQEILNMVEIINERLFQYRPGIFAADFFNSKNGFKLIELNSRPGVCNPDLSPQDKEFNDRIVDFLVDTILKK